MRASAIAVTLTGFSVARDPLLSTGKYNLRCVPAARFLLLFSGARNRFLPLRRLGGPGELSDIIPKICPSPVFNGSSGLLNRRASAPRQPAHDRPFHFSVHVFQKTGIGPRLFMAARPIARGQSG
jgi:hypothetical protein